MTAVPKWSLKGDWFDTCNCAIPCPCTFAQPPTSGNCEGILAWHIRDGSYGDVPLGGLNVMALGAFQGNLWESGTKATMGMFIDERADGRQREALQMIFGGRAAAGRVCSRIPSARSVVLNSLASISRWLTTSRPGEPRFLAGWSPARSRSAARPPFLGSASKCTILAVRRWARTRSPLTASRPPTRRRPSASNGTGLVVRANIYASTGRVLMQAKGVVPLSSCPFGNH